MSGSDLRQRLNIGGDLADYRERAVDIARDVRRRLRLRFGRLGDLAGNIVDFRDHGADFGDRDADAVGGGLHLSDLRLDFGGEIRGLGRQRLDLMGDDGETAPRIARPRRLDRRIQRQQVGLAGDRVDRLDDLADARGDILQHIDAAGGIGHALDGASGDFRGTQNVGADVACIRGKSRRRRRDRLHVGSRLFGRRGNRG